MTTIAVHRKRAGRAYIYEIGDRLAGFAMYRLNRRQVDGAWALSYLRAASRDRDRYQGKPARGNPSRHGLSDRLGVFDTFREARLVMLAHFDHLGREDVA